MKMFFRLVAAAGWITVCTALANEPHIGYAFPAGGQQGTSFELMIGGQYLKGATNVFVSGEGVRVDIDKYAIKYEPRRLRQIYRNIENAKATLEGKEGKERARIQQRIDNAKKQLALAELPEGVDINDKKAVQRAYRIDPKEQFNPQIADRLRVTATISRNATPGERELRVYTPEGLSNPIYFQVGTLPEVNETEPNDDHMRPALQHVPVPSVINGQVRPGDIDHFHFKATKGESIVIDVAARRIIPYLADAVPGWFQAVVALYDEDGREVAYQDDYKFNPDPVLFFDVPETGSYTLSVRDSIYRGREDFIYRIAIGELPFITGIFPLGARQGEEVDIVLSGKNLPTARLTGKLPSNGFEVRHVSVKKQGYRSNQMPFAIGETPEIFETEPNDAPENAQMLEKPLLVNGRIQQSGDIDRYRFEGKKGITVSIEVAARRLNSPLDSVITLSGPGLERAVRNDDYVNKDAQHLHLGAGLVTHHADSYLLCELPASGIYSIEVGDAQSKGGNDYGYRLRVSDSNPDFHLRMEPSGLHIAPGGTAAFTVRASRKEGFEEKIVLSAVELPSGFKMSQSVIPAGSDMARITITAPKEIEGKLVSPEIVGTGIINGISVTRPAVPVDDQMQAFLYRHLVPAQELVLAPITEKPPLSFEAKIPKSGFIELPMGEAKRILFTGRVNRGTRGMKLELDDPPQGMIAEKGWVGRKRAKEKSKDGKPRFEGNTAVGSIMVTAGEPLKPGDEMNIVVAGVMRRGKETINHYAPAIPIKIVEARSN